jgi:hypothetical protein
MTLRPLFLFLMLLVFAVVMESCKFSKAATKSTNDVGSFKDDISSFRPVYAVANETKTTESGSQASDSKPVAKGKPAGDITQKLNVILDTIAVTNKTIRYAQGYRVQIYSGTSSVDANKARDRSYALFPDIIPHIVYIQPNFRVKVGDFIDRLEAQRVFVSLQAEFPSALIVPEKIEIR